MAPTRQAENPDSQWTSDIRDEKLRVLLQGKQGDAENAKILIDLLENGVLGADSPGDSDSDDDTDLEGPGPAAVPLLSSAAAFSPAPIPVHELGGRGVERFVFAESPAPPAVQPGPSTLYELVEVPHLRLEGAASVQTQTLSASAGVTVGGRASLLEENEGEVRELEKQLREKKARLEEMRWERLRERAERAAIGAEANHRHYLAQSTATVEAIETTEMAAWAAAAAPEAADKRAWFSRVKSRVGRLFSRTGAGSTKTGRDRDLPNASNPQSKPNGSQNPSPDDEPVGQHNVNALFVVNDNLPLPNGTQDAPPPAKKPTPPLPPPKVSDSETLLRTKIFAPHTLALMTALPEPVWTSPADPATSTTLFSLTAAPLTRHTLLPQGQFVAQRQRDVTDALSKIELGLGATLPGGVGVNATSTGLLGLLKPYQWINMWRGVEREMYVASHNQGSGSDEKGVDVDMDALHALENELMSPAKYLFGETEYLTVITHSSDVNSGAVSLFRASLGGSGLVTALTLEARFKDMPREICRILRRGVKPNRYELRRSGRALSCREKGGEGVLPPCLAVVRRDGEAEDGEGVEEGWASIGGGWRRALRIVLGEGDAGTRPREGLVATVPQMLAFLHLTHRVVDYVPSTPVFSFEPPLMGMADDGACRGVEVGEEQLLWA